MTHLIKNQERYVARTMKKVHASGQYQFGPYVRELEDHYAALLDRDCAVACGSGTDALTLAIEASPTVPRMIHIPEMTVPMVRWAALRACPRAGIVRVPCEKHTLLMDPKAIHATKGDVVVVVWTAGICTQAMVKRIKELRAAGVWVVEDCAHSHFVPPTGTLGDAAAFSFYPTKAVHCGGDGGLVALNCTNPEAYLRALRNGGKEEGSATVRIGYHENSTAMVSRMSEFAAIVALSFIKFWPDIQKDRQAIADIYREYGIPSLQGKHALPLNGYKYTVPVTPRSYEVTRDRVRDFVDQGGLLTNATHGNGDVDPRTADPTTLEAMLGHVNLPLMRITKDQARKNAILFRDCLI